MRAATRRPRRAGFTLIELVVVIGIIVILLAIGAAFLPGLQGNQKVQTGVDRVSQWLLIAKQRAKHDGLPTGLRFVIDPNNPTLVSQFVYVQQPDFISGDPAVGNSCFTQAQPNTNPPTYPPQITVLFNGSPDFVGGDPNNPLVQNFDYLELFGGGALYQINSNVPNSLNPTAPPVGTVTLNGITYTTLSLSQSYSGVSIPPATTNWRIIRQPRRVIGEDVLMLPQDVVVNIGTLSPPSPSNPAAAYSLNFPTNNQILFSPSGGVIGQTASSGKIVLWAQDVNVPNPTPSSPAVQGNPTLISIQVRTGFIGSYPVLSTSTTNYPNDMYQAALQGRSGF